MTTLITLIAPVRAQLNLGFEMPAPEADAPGVPIWRTSDDDVRAVLDATTARSGERSLRVERRGDGGRGGFSQTLDARDIDGDRLRVSAYVKSAAAAPVAASLRIRVDGAHGLLYIDRARLEDFGGRGEWRRVVIDAPLAPNAERITFGGEVSSVAPVWFDDFEVVGLYARTLSPPSAAARRYVERALAVIEEHAVTRTALDWPAYRRAVLEQARGAASVSDAHLAVQYALAALGDGHSFFMSPRQMTNLSDRPVGNARTARAPVAPQAALLDGAVGYLRLPGIAGGEHTDRIVFAETVQGLIADIDGGARCGWILDLRENEGGNLWPMLVGVGPLLGDGAVGSSLRPGGERRPVWYADGKAGLGDYVQLRVRGEPYRLRRPGSPVALLIDAETASAAEIVAWAFAGRASTRSFGSATRGATSATRTFPLSDGAALMLAVASLVDRNGRVLAGPIEPDEPVDEAGGRALEDQAVVSAAGRWLASISAEQPRSGCTPLGGTVSARGDERP